MRIDLVLARRAGRRARARGLGRPAGAQGQRAERPRAGDRRPRRGARRRHRPRRPAAVGAGRAAAARRSCRSRRSAPGRGVGSGPWSPPRDVPGSPTRARAATAARTSSSSTPASTTAAAGGTSSTAWRPRHRCVSYDMRGFGETTYERDEAGRRRPTPSPCSMRRACERAVVVACSMGGQAAIDLALAHPDRVGGAPADRHRRPRRAGAGAHRRPDGRPHRPHRVRLRGRRPRRAGTAGGVDVARRAERAGGPRGRRRRASCSWT